MKREFLKSLDLKDEVIDSIMSEYGKGVQADKDKRTELETQVTELTDQLATRDKDISKLKKDAGSNEGLAQKYSDLQAKYKESDESWKSKLAQTKLDNALDNALRSAKARDPETIRPKLDMDTISLSDKGELIGLSEQLDNLKDSSGYLFDEGTHTDYEPHGGQDLGGQGHENEEKSVKEMAAEARII